jgi:hypothetical protein
MMKTLLLRLLSITLFTGIFTGNALALRCLEPSVEVSFQYFKDEPGSYIIVLGTLSEQRNIITAPLDENGNGQGRFFTATFVGKQGNRAGFQQYLSEPVQVQETCAGPWCGRVETGEEQVMIFLEKTAYGLQLTEGPCRGTVFYSPSKERINHALQCLRGGVCAPH